MILIIFNFLLLNHLRFIKIQMNFYMLLVKSIKHIHINDILIYQLLIFQLFLLKVHLIKL